MESHLAEGTSAPYEASPLSVQTMPSPRRCQRLTSKRPPRTPAICTKLHELPMSSPPLKRLKVRPQPGGNWQVSASSHICQQPCCQSLIKPSAGYFANIAHRFPKSRIAPAAFRSNGQLRLPFGTREAAQCSMVGSSSLTSFPKHVSRAFLTFCDRRGGRRVGRADRVPIHVTPCPVQCSSVVTAFSDCCRMSTSSAAKTSAAFRAQVRISPARETTTALS